MQPRFYRRPHLVGPNGLTGVSKSTLDRLIRAGTFPPPVHLGPRLRVWPSEVVHAWLAAQARQGAAAQEGGAQ